MLKRFLTAFLGSLTAIWLSVILFIVLIFSTTMFMISMSADDNGIREHSVLYIDLSGSVSERALAPDLSEIALYGVNESTGLDVMIKAVRQAAGDDKIEGVFINCNGSSMGYASREELREALLAFKKSGKWVCAYGESVSQGDYYVASCADKFYLNPSGSVDVRGMASEIPFFKNALDKLGVEVQVMKVGTYKSAVEPYILTEPSEASLKQTHVFLNAIWSNVIQSIASSRGVKPARVNAWADSILYFRPSTYAFENNVVTALYYRRQVDDIIREACHLDKKDDIRFVTPDNYISKGLTDDNIDSGIRGRHIAVYYAFGDIVDYGKEGIVGSTVTSDIIKLADDDNVAALVLRVNSGGGSAFASEQIWEALEYFKSTNKPFYVSMGDYAASGGYYISCGANKIYADHNTLTGSIGIFGLIPCAQELLNDKIGVNLYTIATNYNAAFPNIFYPLTPKQRDAIQESVEDGYRLFTTRVAEGRKLPVDSVLKIAEGRVWDGATALKIGLVDNLGSLDATIKAIAKRVKLDPDKCVSYPKVSVSPFERMLLDIMSEKVKMGETITVGGLEPEEVKNAMRQIRRIRNMGHMQARMEDVTLK